MSTKIESSFSPISTSSPTGQIDEQNKVFLAKFQFIDPVLTPMPPKSLTNIPAGCIETQTDFFLPGEDGKGGNCGVYIGETKQDCQLYVYDAMTNFIQQCKQKITNSKELKFSIGVLPFGHYNPKDAIYGPRSNRGCMSDEFVSNLPPIHEKYELFNIHFEIKNRLLYTHVPMIEKLSITSGPRSNKYDHYFTMVKPEQVKCGKYKKPGFDEIHTSLQKVYSEMKEIEVLDYISEKHHSKLYSLDPYTVAEGCIETAEIITYDNSCVTLSFTTQDLISNSDKLIEILSNLLD